MNIKSSVMTVAAGLAFAALVPAQAQVLGGTLGGAGNVVLGGGGIAGGASGGGMLNSDLRDRLQAARERTQSTAESAGERVHHVAAGGKATAESGVQKARAGARSAAQNPAKTSGSAASSTSVEKHAAKRTAKADSNSATDFSADRSGLVLGGSHASSASMTRDEPAPSEPEPVQE
jgi:hypothetical protein